MLNIRIGEKWIITSDSCNYILRRITKDKETKKEIFGEPTYYNKLRHLVDELIEKDVRNTNIKSLEKLAKHIADFKEEIKKEISPELYESIIK